MISWDCSSAKASQLTLCLRNLVTEPSFSLPKEGTTQVLVEFHPEFFCSYHPDHPTAPVPVGDVAGSEYKGTSPLSQGILPQPLLTRCTVLGFTVYRALSQVSF